MIAPKLFGLLQPFRVLWIAGIVNQTEHWTARPPIVRITNCFLNLGFEAV
jgi:hypothetical protein